MRSKLKIVANASLHIKIGDNVKCTPLNKVRQQCS